MKKLKDIMLLLTAGAFFSLSACGGLTSERELEPGLTSADVSVTTYEPQINDKEVTLNAGIVVDVDKLDQQLVWGFMWFVDNGTAERDIQKMVTGRGFYSGTYKIIKDDFPSGEQIGFCAFVDFKASPNAQVEQIVGEEIWFDAR